MFDLAVVLFTMVTTLDLFILMASMILLALGYLVARGYSEKCCRLLKFALLLAAGFSIGVLLPWLIVQCRRAGSFPPWKLFMLDFIPTSTVMDWNVPPNSARFSCSLRATYAPSLPG